MMNIFKNKKAFTVAEMLVVIFIIGLTASITLVNFRKGERSGGFLLTTEQLASDLRKIQTRTIAGLINQTTTLTGGYGFYITNSQPQQYILFNDDGDLIFDAETDNVLETIVLPIGVTFIDFPSDEVTVIFKPPKPTIYSAGDKLLTTISLYLVDSAVSGKKGLVTLNGLTGRITAELVNN